MSSLAAGAGPSSCHHMFVKTSMLRGVTRCFGCQELCFVLTSMRRCNVCGIHFHESCFQKSLLLAPSLSTATAATPSSAAAGALPTGGDEGTKVIEAYGRHTHELYWTSVVLPKRCDACQGFLPPGRRAALCCLECDTIVHEGCTAKLGDDLAIVDDATAEKRTTLTDTLRDAVLCDTFALLKQFTEHHHHWALSAVNPLAMKEVQVEHGRIYIEACDRLVDAALPANQLHDVRRALRYSTAVYGLAYEAGFMSDALSNILMRVAHRHVLAPKAENNNVAVMQVLQMPRDALVHAKWGRDVFEPSYAVIVDIEAQWIVLAFRGSLSDSDFLTDACGHLKPFCGGMAHEGITTMLDAVFADTKLLECIAHHRQLHPGFKIVVTGHSLGGGLTELFVMRAVHEGLPAASGETAAAASMGSDEVPLVAQDAERQRRGLRRFPASVVEKCFTADWIHGFAFAPPPVATMPLAECFDAVLTAVVAGKDMVPRLQLSSVDRLGARLARSGHPSAKTAGISDGVEECFIAGTILFSTKPNNVNTRLTFLDRTSVLLRDVFVSPQYMVQNHLMDNYAAALAAVEAASSAPSAVASAILVPASKELSDGFISVAPTLTAAELT